MTGEEILNRSGPAKIFRRPHGHRFPEFRRVGGADQIHHRAERGGEDDPLQPDYRGLSAHRREFSVCWKIPERAQAPCDRPAGDFPHLPEPGAFPEHERPGKCHARQARPNFGGYFPGGLSPAGDAARGAENPGEGHGGAPVSWNWRTGRGWAPALYPWGSRNSWRSPGPWPRQPRLLLLDEPAAGLNIRETEKLSETILRIRERGITVMLVEHDMSLVMGISDEVLVLNYGKKIAEGVPREIQRNRGGHRRLPGGGGRTMLRVESVSAFYGAIQALRNVSLHVSPGGDGHPSGGQRGGENDAHEDHFRNPPRLQGKTLVQRPEYLGPAGGTDPAAGSRSGSRRPADLRPAQRPGQSRPRGLCALQGGRKEGDLSRTWIRSSTFFPFCGKGRNSAPERSRGESSRWWRSAGP